MFSPVKMPTSQSKVYKKECMLCFESDLCKEGLFVCLERFFAFDKVHLTNYNNVCNADVFLNVKRMRVEGGEASEQAPKTKVTKLAIGVEGGFDLDKKKEQFACEYEIYVYSLNKFFSLDDESLPVNVKESANALIGLESDDDMYNTQTLVVPWNDEPTIISKHSDDLFQVSDPPKIHYDLNNMECEVCQMKGDGLLWMNLSDGKIHCGRKQFDGSGGNNHALEHYEKTKYPLAVKLGTISSDSTSDVYSYDEEVMVFDKNLHQHLLHFGIDSKELVKTFKGMMELNIELNQKTEEWSLLQETNSKLVKIEGPGYKGIKNLGNSCYISSVMQTLFSLDEFHSFFSDNMPSFLKSAIDNNDPLNSLNLQLSKLNNGIYYSNPENKDALSLLTLKRLVGKNHSEFASSKQQDCLEYFQYILSLINRSNSYESPSKLFELEIVEKLTFETANNPIIKIRSENCLSLPLNLQNVDNEEVMPKTELLSCIQKLFSLETIEDFIHPKSKEKVKVNKTSFIHKFPKYLLLHMQKFSFHVAQNGLYTSKKLQVSLNVPDEIDLTQYASNLSQYERSLMINEKDCYNKEYFQEMLAMGFSESACKSALHATNNASLEAALEYIFLNPDLMQNSSYTNHNDSLNQATVDNLTAMGFQEAMVKEALSSTDNDLNRAIDWLESRKHLSLTQNSTSNYAHESSKGKYKLIACVSHMGPSVQSGHYLCHILKESKWVIFNDESIAISQNVPKDLAYLYLYMKVDS